MNNPTDNTGNSLLYRALRPVLLGRWEEVDRIASEPHMRSSMMELMVTEIFDIDSMPRGGPEASWLDRLMQTNRLEYLDRDDVDDKKRKVLQSLERGERMLGQHEIMARIALDEIVGVPDPRIIELGAGHGGLSRAILEIHPTAHVTVTDVEPSSLAAIAAGDLGSHPRAEVRHVDATAIDAPDDAYELAVFSQSLHHLPPRPAAKVFAEGTRVASKLLIIDLTRLSPLRQAIQLPFMLPLTMLSPLMHDGYISGLRAYSPSALQKLASYADPDIGLDVRRSAFNLRGRWQLAVASRKTSRPPSTPVVGD